MALNTERPNAEFYNTKPPECQKIEITTPNLHTNQG
jgi:hypothetical protein